jgi:hypothetical protein
MTIRTGRDFGGISLPMLVAGLVLALSLPACTQYRVAPNDGGDSSGIGGAGDLDGPVGGTAGGNAATDGGIDAPKACSTNMQCEACETCASGGLCVALLNQDDPVAGRCTGTCDASGVCRSKRGQTCQATSGGCVAGTVCSPDGVCCNSACGNSCQACDIPGFLGTCTPVASGPPHGNRASCGTGTCTGSCSGQVDGMCAFPSPGPICGPASSCSGTDLVGQGTCQAGACVTPPSQKCSNALI